MVKSTNVRVTAYPRSLRRSVALAAALAVTLAACGGGDEPGAAEVAPDDTATDGAAAPDDTATDGAPALGDEKQEALQTLYQEATAAGESEVVVTTSDPAAEALADAFMEEFPDIEVRVISRTGGVTTEQLVSEVASGSDPSIDAGFTTFSTIGPLRDRDLIDNSTDFTEYGVSEDLILLEGDMIIWYDQVQVVCYNTDLVTGDDVPTEWEDVLQDEFNGAIAADPRGHGIGPYAFLVGQERAREVAEEIVERGPVYLETSGSRMSQGVGSGQALVGFGCHLDKTLTTQENGAPIDYVRHDEVPVQEFGWFIPRNAENPNAARMWIVWNTTEAASEVFGESNSGTVTPGSTGPLMEAFTEAGMTGVRLHDYEEFIENVEFRAEIVELFGAQ